MSQPPPPSSLSLAHTTTTQHNTTHPRHTHTHTYSSCMSTNSVMVTGRVGRSTSTVLLMTRRCLWGAGEVGAGGVQKGAPRGGSRSAGGAVGRSGEGGGSEQWGRPAGRSGGVRGMARGVTHVAQAVGLVSVRPSVRLIGSGESSSVTTPRSDHATVRQAKPPPVLRRRLPRHVSRLTSRSESQ